MKQLQTIIRTNERVATALGHPFMVQLGHIYVDLLNVYKAYSELINSTIAAGSANAHVMHTSGVRAMRAVKKETLQQKLLRSSKPTKVGFWGMGGIGKTVTGAALVRDSEVRDHFDQIVWSPLGPVDDDGVPSHLRVQS